MKCNLFYIPLLYFYITRIKSIPALINWLFIYVVPTFILFHFMVRHAFSAEMYLGYVVIVLAIYSVYEAGYIQNDAETIKLESDPTLRLSSEQLEYYDKNKSIIYGTRFVLSLFLGWIASFLTVASTVQMWQTLISLSMIAVVFYIYNHIRSFFTLILLWLLVSLRYITPLMLVYIQEDKFYLFFIILLYPVLNLLDWTYKSRFKGCALPFGQTAMRIGYYILLNTVFGYLYYSMSTEEYKVALFLSLYFLVYRILFSFVYRRIEK